MTLRGWDTEGMPEIDRAALSDAMSELIDRLDLVDRMTDSERDRLDAECDTAAETFIEQQAERWRA